MQFDVAPFAMPAKELPRPTPNVATEVLRQMLDVQREQLELMKANHATLHSMAEAQSQARKKSWFDRWQQEFPDLPDGCRHAMPVLERAYLNLITHLIEEVRENGDEGFESDFALRDFLDRFGFPLVHLGGILQAIAPLTEINNQQNETAQ